MCVYEFMCILLYVYLFICLLIFSLRAGGTFLYCAPDDARDGMDQFLAALAAVHLQCVSQQPCPEE